MGHLFHYGTKTWEFEELTGDEIIALETLLDVRWFALEPGSKMRDTLAILATFLSRDRSEEQVEKIIKRITYKDMLDRKVVTYVDESSLPTEFDGEAGDLPKVTAPTSGTGTSSSATRRGTGPRQSRGRKASGT